MADFQGARGNRGLGWGIQLLGLLFLPWMATAQLPTARLLTLSPPGGMLGSTVEVTVVGQDLNTATRLSFNTPTITAELRAGDDPNSPDTHRFILHLATNASPGIYEARVVGRFGISNPRAFVVGDRPEALIPNTNETFAFAAPLATGTTVDGHASAGAAQYFKIAARGRERLIITLQAGEIDSRLVPNLLLYDANGRELERGRRNGLIDYTPTADGPLVLKLSDASFRGGSEYFYRLSAGTGPHLEFVYPPAGVPGTRAKFILYGRNLPGGTPSAETGADGKYLDQLAVEIELPADPLVESTALISGPVASLGLPYYTYGLPSAQGISNPIRIGLTTAPEIATPMTNAPGDPALQLILPCEWAGRFAPRGGWSSANFTAKKGDSYRVEVYSHRLGWATAPFVVIQRLSKNEKGEEQDSELQELAGVDTNLGGAEYKSAHRDPAGRFSAPEDGTYRVRIRDQFANASTPTPAMFRVSLRREAPDFDLLVVAPAPPPANKDTKEAQVWTPFLRRGETQPLKVTAFRHDDFTGEIQLSVEGLPRGITAGPAHIEKDKNITTVLLTASAEVNEWAGPIQILGKATIASTETTRVAHGATVRWTVPDYNTEAVASRLTADFVVGASGVESAPLSISPAENKTWEVPAGSKLAIPLRVVRNGDFGATLKMKAAGLAGLDSLKEIEIAGSATNATLDLDLGEHKLAPGNYTFHLTTQTTGKYRRLAELAKSAGELAQAAEKMANEASQAVKTAAEASQAAAKAMSAAETQRKEAAAALAQADQTVKETAELVRLAGEKLTAATAAQSAQTDAADLVAAKNAAAEGLEKARARSQTAQEAQVAAAARAAAAAKDTERAAATRQTATSAETEAKSRLPAAEGKRDAAKKRAQEAGKTAEPRDVTITVHSAPITLQVTPAPAGKPAAK